MVSDTLLTALLPSESPFQSFPICHLSSVTWSLFVNIPPRPPLHFRIFRLWISWVLSETAASIISAKNVLVKNEFPGRWNSRSMDSRGIGELYRPSHRGKAIAYRFPTLDPRAHRLNGRGGSLSSI